MAEREQPIPGPWEANARDGTLKVRGPATAKKYKQREVCRIYGANQATVDLIVAAPDLLAAIKKLMQFGCAGEGTDEQVKGWDDAMTAAERAVAKAEGDSNSEDET